MNWPSKGSLVTMQTYHLTPNLVCISCGSVIDSEVGQDTVSELRGIISEESSFTVASQRVDFYGLCEGCSP
ncbi:MAG: hypothetical protein CM1200mP15_04590 [Dehalococcoidia bacterium]|nr:MAG: hypothetical protein CM1200mP15_04590 [Dehalococcoidia bacterium]